MHECSGIGWVDDARTPSRDPVGEGARGGLPSCRAAFLAQAHVRLLQLQVQKLATDAKAETEADAQPTLSFTTVIVSSLARPFDWKERERERGSGTISGTQTGSVGRCEEHMDKHAVFRRRR